MGFEIYLRNGERVSETANTMLRSEQNQKSRCFHISSRSDPVSTQPTVTKTMTVDMTLSSQANRRWESRDVRGDVQRMDELVVVPDGNREIDSSPESNFSPKETQKPDVEDKSVKQVVSCV